MRHSALLSNPRALGLLKIKAKIEITNILNRDIDLNLHLDHDLSKIKMEIKIEVENQGSEENRLNLFGCNNTALSLRVFDFLDRPSLVSMAMTSKQPFALVFNYRSRHYISRLQAIALALFGQQVVANAQMKLIHKQVERLQQRDWNLRKLDLHLGWAMMQLFILASQMLYSTSEQNATQDQVSPLEEDDEKKKSMLEFYASVRRAKSAGTISEIEFDIMLLAYATGALQWDCIDDQGVNSLLHLMFLFAREETFCIDKDTYLSQDIDSQKRLLAKGVSEAIVSDRVRYVKRLASYLSTCFKRGLYQMELIDQVIQSLLAVRREKLAFDIICAEEFPLYWKKETFGAFQRHLNQLHQKQLFSGSSYAQIALG